MEPPIASPLTTMTTYPDYGPNLPANTPRDGGEHFRIPPEMQAILNRPGIQSGDKSEQLLKLYSQSKFCLHEPQLVAS